MISLLIVFQFMSVDLQQMMREVRHDYRQRKEMRGSDEIRSSYRSPNTKNNLP